MPKKAATKKRTKAPEMEVHEERGVTEVTEPFLPEGEPIDGQFIGGTLIDEQAPALTEEQTQHLARRTGAVSVQRGPSPDEMLGVIERLAKDPAFDVAKMQALIDMRDISIDKQRARDLEDDARAAKKAFTRDFVKLQAELPAVDEKGDIWDKGHTKVVSTYGLWEDVMDVLRPIISRFGFALTFKTVNLEQGLVQTLGFLEHVEGHTKDTQFTGAPDESGFKNPTQGIGSIRSYGKRYCGFDLLNITTRGEDDDAASAHTPNPPAGFEDWEIDMGAAADDGLQAFGAAWNHSQQSFKDYAVKYRKDAWEQFKKRAVAVTEKRKAEAEREPGEDG